MYHVPCAWLYLYDCRRARGSETFFREVAHGAARRGAAAEEGQARTFSGEALPVLEATAGGQAAHPRRENALVPLAIGTNRGSASGEITTLRLESYIHRCARAPRAGFAFLSFSFSVYLDGFSFS